MEKQYRSELQQIYFTEESKKILIQNLNTSQSKKSKNIHIPRFSAVAVCVFLMLLSTTALAIGFPILKTYFKGNGYEQSATLLGKSVIQEGWTLTLTDCVGDDRYLYFGIEVAAPKGIVLDEEDYRLEDYDFSVLGMDDYVMAWHLTQVPDDNKKDNIIRFILWIQGGYYKDTFNNKTIELNFKNIYHVGEWNEVEESREKLYDLKAEWHFDSVKMNYPDNMIRLQPNSEVDVLDVKATLTNLEVSPIGVMVTIEGDELKGHHQWVPKDAPDGWYSCNDEPTINLYDKEGNLLEPDEMSAPFGVRAGSGCWGGSPKNDEEGKLKIVQSYGYLIDMDSLDYIEVCGIKIPLK